MPQLLESRDGAASLVAFGGLTAAAAGFGARYSGNSRWYRKLKKPPFQPPPWVFGPAWTVLYGLIAFSGWRVWRQRQLPEARRALRRWGVQLGLNAAWSWLFFGRKRPALALADLVALQLANASFARSAARVDPAAAWSWAPYLGWVTFAGVLNEEVVRRNR